ncbi:MAG: hypothetical protein M1839_004489 [Geoglossum umbratile]|nr:MAG: hypothetical protein M1839_004489 [Geoglossum umbratile]
MGPRYQYNLLKAYAARGQARSDQLDRSREKPAVGQSLQLNARLAKSKTITKVVSPPREPNKSEGELLGSNKDLCKPCQRLFDGLMDQAQSISKSESGDYYLHWDFRYLEKSAACGCPLCLLIHRSLGNKRTALKFGEAVPGRYDVGTFAGSDETYALRFYYYIILRRDDDVVPVSVGPVTLTLQSASTIQPLMEGAVGSPNTGSPGSLESIKSWLDTCNKSHAYCKKLKNKNKSTLLPTRLIDVGTISGLGCVRLVESRIVPSGAQYLTLSHCWGSSGLPSQLKLTAQFLPFFEEQIPMELLPKTFLDAIEVTKCLGIRYLWIDSLCIIQDREEDWKREAATMWQVYTNSYLNISATASMNSSQGLFRDRSELTLKPWVVKVQEGHPLFASGEYCCFDEADWECHVDNGHVNSRAWVCQEYLLSPRIINFSEDQLFWECHELKASEQFPGGIPPRCDTSTQRNFLHSIEEHQEPKEYLKVWGSIVERYTAGSLSRPSDKLIAVSALAMQISKMRSNADIYLAGLWRSDLVDQLLWTSSSTAVRSQRYRAPSWSWACMDGYVGSHFNWPKAGPEGGQLRSSNIATVLEATVEHSSNPYSSAKGGVLRLSAPLLKVNLIADKEHRVQSSVFNEEDQSLMTIGVDAEAGVLSVNESAHEKRKQLLGEREYYVPFPHTHKARSRLDEDYDVESAREVFFLPLQSFHETGALLGEFEIASIDGLIVEPTKAQKGQFRRLGTCCLDEYAAGEFFCALGNQDPGELEYEAISPEKLPLSAFVPRYWNGNDLDFIPKEYECYIVSLV